MRNARSQDAGFADACASENENRPLERVHSAPLLFVQAVEIGWIGRPDATRERPRGSSVVAPRFRRRDSRRVGCLRRLRHKSNHALAGQRAQPEISIPAGLRTWPMPAPYDLL